MTNSSIRLLPEVERPIITVDTSWRAASPSELEAEVIEPQEEVLSQVEGLYELWSSAVDGWSTLTLVFEPGTDMDAALSEVSSPTYS